MSSGIDCGKLEEILESIFRIPIDAAKLEKWVNGGEYETVMLGDKEVPTLRNLIRQLDERTSQAAEEEINEAKKEIGALAAKIQAKIDELKAMTASAETLPPGHPATVYYNASTGEFEFGIPEGKQGIQGEPGLAPTIDIIYAGDPSEQALDIIYGGNPALDEPKDRTIIRQVNRIGTSAAWTIANPILEDGEQGFERTPEDKLLWKMGDGVTHWNDLPYPPILIDTIYRYRGSVQTVDDLPTDAKPGDVYNVIDTGANYAWTGEAWDNLGVVQEIDPAPIRDSGNPVASGGVYAALEKMQQDIAATGAPDTVTIIKNADGKLVAKNIAIGGDPTDLASARGQIGNTPTVGPHDFSTGMLAEKSGLYAAYQSGSTNGPFDGPYAELIARVGGQAGSILFSSGRIVGKRAALGAVSSTIGFGGYNRLITEEQIGDGMRVTNGMVSVPEYEGATATQPGTAGLVNPATPEERDYVYHGDGTWREITSVGSGKLTHAEINTYHKRDVVVTPTSFDVGELYYGDDISTTGRVFTQKVNDGIKILEDGIYNVLLEIGVYNVASITGDLVFETQLVARESGKLSSPIVMSTGSIYINTIPADIDSGSTIVTKSFKAGDIIAPYLSIQQGDVFILQWVSVVLTKFPSVVSTAGSTADVAVDNVTITKNNNVLSVLPEGFVDNKSIFVNKEGKLESKSIPFDGGSIFDIVSEKYGSDFPSIIFGDPASGAFIIPELTSPFMTYNFYDKEIFGHVQNDRFVFDTEGFYIVSAKWRGIPSSAAVSFDSILQIVQVDENDNVSVLGEDDLRVDQHVELSTTTTLTCAVWAKPGQGIQSRLFIPKSNSTNDVSIIAWHVRIMKLPNTNEYQVQNAEYFGCYQREWVLSPAQVLPEDATKKFVNIDWTLGNTVNENPNALSIVPNKGVVPSRTGLVLLNFGLSVNVLQGTNVYDLVCQVFRKNAAGQDVLVRTGTFRLYEGQINADLFNLVILLPMQEGDGVWFRILVPAVFNDLGYVASLSGTVFPSVAASVQNGSAYKTITLTNEDNLDTLKPGSYYQPSDVHPKGTLPYNDTNPNDYTIVVYGTSEQVDESYKQVVFSHTNTYKILIREVKNGKWNPWYQPITTSNPTSYGIVKLATEEQVRAGTETGAYALTPALAKLAVETFGAPRPQAADGVGRWQAIGTNGTSVTLPPKATWAYFVQALENVQGRLIINDAGVAAGGTTLTYDPNLGINLVCGFAWRITK
ncbi:pyocin knob domain-containing protein [uncultured Desulfovibrio sp.]|uniref:pyocin knob domain-containing protein n=1 Tax=uncultured Desulfovibrio sp. TaxID=167968 RepID=UPI002729539D|nr:pyocin knob domain-containing protein [uncultured Desulfovibrio sp.]